MNTTSSVMVTSTNGTAFHECFAFRYPFAFEVYAVLCPAIALLTLFTNILVIVVFTKKQLRSPTSVLLIGLAIGDILAGNLISPSYIYAYGISNTDVPLPYPMCLFYDYGGIFASVFHQTSVWITMVLGIQRYIVVAFPIVGRRICTIKNSVLSVILINVASLLMYLITLFSTKYDFKEIDGEPVCFCLEAEGISNMTRRLISILRCVFGQLVPCAVLTITTVLLVRRLRISKRKMTKIRAKDSSKRDKKDSKSMRRTSYMVILIVSSFLLAEIPNGLYFAVNSMQMSPLSNEATLKIATILNVLVYVINHINFWIYISLSRHFRHSISKILRLNKLLNLCSKKIVNFGSQQMSTIHSFE